MVSLFPENTWNLCIFTHAPFPHSKFEVEETQDERGGGNYNLLYQNSIRKYEYDLEHNYLYFV